MKNHIENEGYTFDASQLEKCLNYNCKKISELWQKCKRTKLKVLQKYSDWLAQKETILLNPQASTSNQDRGRPRVRFTECSSRTKRRRIAELAEIDVSAADDLRFATLQTKPSILPVNVNEVISIITEASLTKHQYLLIRNFINSKIDVNLLPSYDSILKAKKKSYPDQITISESHAEVELQSLLNHTATRILELQSDVINEVLDDSVNGLTLIGKWGFDGSSGQSEYKQTVQNNDLDDSHLFVTSYVPLQLVTKPDEAHNTKIIWKNPRPSSTRYCRPIRFQFKKESVQVSIDEEKYFKEKIANLIPTKFTTDQKTIYIEHILQLTMVDGKVCNALTQTSSAKCYICNAKPTEMNNIEQCLQKEVKKDHYEFGLSPLHAYIRFFEYFLHVSYRLELKQWQIRSSEGKAQLLKTKQNIQLQFREKMGLIVDKPKTGGSGSSNDGNTARDFFNNASLSAQITGLDKDVIEKCATLLQALSSGYKINVEKFREYALDTAKDLTQKYSWYYLPPSVHKILIHAPDVIEHALVSIGELSEEAAESRNKDIKKFRLHHTRKTSRVSTNTDLFNRLLLTSDPFITGQRKLPSKHQSILLKSVFDLLD